jgi:hypothetical protein
MKQIDCNKNMAELMQDHPALGAVLAELGIDCADCLASHVDTFADVVRMYQLDVESILARVQSDRYAAPVAASGRSSTTTE